MKLILRKNDSATSLLLFVYNLYLTKTTEPYIKLSTLLKILQCFDKNETAIRMSLSRAVKSGFLVNYKENGEVLYALSKNAMHAIEVWNEGADNFWRRFALRRAPWDHKWHVLNVRLTDHKQNKSEIMDQFQQLGYAVLDTNTWISPYHHKKEMELLAEKYDLKENLFEIYGEIEPGKGISAFCDSVFNVESIESKYAEFAQSIEEAWKQEKDKLVGEAFVQSGKALVFLHEMGWRFFDIASEDAVLPEKLLPNWSGDHAAKLMKELRPQLMEAAWKYVEQCKQC